MAEERRQETDLVLPPGLHAFILDATKGNVSVYVGPMKQPLSQQDIPVVLNGDGRFTTVAIEQAKKNNVVARKGEYVILNNPAKEMRFPKAGTSSTTTDDMLRIGETVNVPGPATFPLWPMQAAHVVAGHHIRSNQYLLVRVYDEEAARANWSKGTVKLVDQGSTGGGGDKEDKPPVASQGTTSPASNTLFLGMDPTKLVIGQLIIIKGTEVSFYIPPTGVEVLAEDDESAVLSNRAGATGNYVRDALTLERLEYCLLVDENGNKRYVKGPEVVFPAPTETFKLNDDKSRKSQAYELNEISGLHVKVIAAYRDDFGKDHKEGDELFITGKHTPGVSSEEETSIYFPRVEHAILKYDGKTRSHAIAIPPGEARYVMNRLTGVVRLERGPSMFLPDPRKEVIVKRVLSQGEVDTYYPGNAFVKQYNDELRVKDVEAEMAAALTGLPATRGGHVATAMMASLADTSYASSSRAADVLERSTRFTPPRTLILNSKFEGAVNIRPYTGFAIQVVNQAGDRRIEIGPKTVQLEFDERLDILALSTKTPKNEDQTIKAAYLRISNNSVSDQFVIKTQDLVQVEIKLKYLVRFEEASKDKWFAISNYVQHMCDRFRSLVSNYGRTVDIQEFYAKAGSLLRDLILGAKKGAEERSGYTFDENGMRVYELDVLQVKILDQSIGASMENLQKQRINNFLETSKQRSDLDLVIARERNLREEASAKHETQVSRHDILIKEAELSSERTERELRASFAVDQMKLVSEREDEKLRLEIAKLEVEASKIKDDQSLETERARMTHRIFELVEAAGADKTRLEALSPQLTSALVAVANTGAMPMIAKAFGDLSIVRQQSLGGTFEAMFKGTPLEGFLENMKSLGAGSALSKA